MSPLSPSQPILRFGDFDVNLRSCELRKHGKRIKLQVQPFQVLQILLEHPGEVVSREELQKRIWPADTYVDFDQGLNNAVKKLRGALGDDADSPRFIETLSKRGYRFVAPVHGSNLKKPVVNAGRWKIAAPVVIVVVVTAAAAGGWFWHSRHGGVLTEKDTIVLGDFMNSTGDPVFDDTLKQGLRVQLEQSPFLNILSDQRVSDLLQMMGRAKDDHLPPQVAREVCQRANSKVVVTGSIARLGSHYVIALNALNCQTGDALASEQVEADNRDRVLKALGESATGVRKKLGESLASIQKYDVPLEQATTPSLEALKAYSLAIKTWGANGEVDSLPFFHRALELDPDFALAHANLGDAYENLGEPDLAAEYASKAFQLRERATERERFEISIVYYFQKTGDLLKGIQTAELWRQSYPHSSLPYHYASVAYEFLGQYEKAATYGLEALRFDPEGRNLHSNLMEDYLALNRSEEAKTVYQKALERKLDTAFLHDDRYVLAFFEGDNAEMSRQVAWAAGKEGAEDMLLSAESDTEAFFGHSQKARQLTRKAIESATKSNQKDTAALWELDNALQEAEFGNSPEARREAQSGLARASTRDVQILAALALARAGDTAGSQAISERLEKLLPYNTELNGYWLPSIRAAIQIHRGNPAQAIELLEVAKPYDLAFPRPQAGGGGLLYPVWLRGVALLLLNRGNEATLEFQRILDHRGMVLNEPIGALAHLQLGRAYAMQGDTAKARAAYQDFFALWKDADPDIPILKQAKAEYSKLK